MRPYKDYSLKDLLKLRDALDLARDTALDGSREWNVFDEELTWVSEEIDVRYKELNK